MEFNVSVGKIAKLYLKNTKTRNGEMAQKPDNVSLSPVTYCC